MAREFLVATRRQGLRVVTASLIGAVILTALAAVAMFLAR